MKFLKTIALLITFASALALWLTRENYMESISAFALSKNALYYRTMHLSMVFFFLINAVDFKKYATEFVLAAGVAGILIFDMYNNPVLHNIFTVGTLVLACITLLINVKEDSLSRELAVLLVLCTLGIFAVGYYTDMHFFLAEVLAMGFVATGKLIEVYK